MKTKIYKLLSGGKHGLFALVLTVFSGTIFSQTTFTFSYTGSTQTISLLPGSYSIQCWGGDGGNATNGTNPMLGGKGGYSSGVYTNTATAIFNVYVGGRGGNASGSAVGGGGGGMSDIAPASNSTLIIIAAGAGGGGTSSGTTSELSTGGNGGGLIGGTAIDGSGVSGGTAATGGSQTAGGFATPGSYGAGTPGGYGYGGGAANGGTAGVIHSAGGAGGNGGAGGWNGGGGGSTLTGINDNAAGGGAGYYGGGGGRGDGGAGGGGSSYIGGVTSATTIMFGQTGFVSNPDVLGNGRVLITELCSIAIYSSGSSTLSPSICSGQSLTLTTNAISNYSWSTGQTTSSIVVAPTTNTVYSLSGTSSLACTANANMSVVVSAGLPLLSISNPSTSICLGLSATLTASGAVSHTWSGGVVNGVPFTPSLTQTYTVTGQNGCGISTATTAVTVAPLSVTVSATPSIVCEGSSAVLSASSAVSGYTWLPMGAFTASTVASPTALTVYTVSVSDGTCSGVSTVTVDTKPTPSVTAVGSTSTLCENATLTLTASGAQTYSWTPVNLTGQSITVTPSISALYNVTGTNSVGCSNSANWVVIVNPAPPTVASSNKGTVCVGEPAVLSAGGASTYVWAGGPSSQVYSVNPTTNTTYTVTGTGMNGCTKAATVSVAVYNPSLTLTASAPGLCKGGNVNLTASTPGAITYSWNGITGLPFMAVSPTVTTVYTVSAISASMVNCAVSNTIQVAVYPNPTVSVVATKTTMCKGGSPAVLTASGASSYLWASNNATTTSINAPSTNIGTVTYSVTGTDQNDCEGSASIQVKVEGCVGIGTIHKIAAVVNVYPNPNNGEFTISTPGDADLKLINELGQEIKQFSLSSSNNHKVLMSGMAAGIYFIVGQTEHSSFNQKIVVTQ